jgi:hypothetical protein
MPRTAIRTLPPTAGPDPKRWRKRLKRVAWLGLGLLGMLLVVFLLLPVWISNEQGRQYVLERLNRGSAAKISVDDWSLSWFKSTRLKNLSITMPDGSRMLFCPRVKTELTLWGILFGHYDVGTTNIDTLQLTLTKYPDGTTSLDALAPPAQGGSLPASSRLLARLRSARGSVQVQSAVVTINSVRAGQSVTYTDVNAAITIASPDAPFHVRVAAVGPDRALSLNATLPAPAAWPPEPWTLVEDIDVAATNLPTGLACDWVRLDPRWQESLGPVMESLSLVHHGAGADASDAFLSVRSPSRSTSLDARCLLQTSPASVTVKLPAGEDYTVRAALLPSPPLMNLVARANPLLRSVKTSDGPLAISVSAANWSSDRPGEISGVARVTFPRLTFDRAGLLGQLLNFAGEPAGGSGQPVSGEASPMRVDVSDGAATLSPFSLTLAPRYRIIVQGRTTLDGQVDLLATVPLAPGGVWQSGTADIPIRGTIEHPAVTLPK